MQYSFRAATRADVEFLVGLKEDSYRDHIEALGVLWEPSRNEANVLAAVDSQSLELVTSGDAPVGALGVEWNQDPVLLASIELVAAARGKGLGTCIVKGVLLGAAKSGRDVRLQVLRPSRARKLYERFGFQTVSETETHVAMLWQRLSMPAPHGEA